MSMDCHSIPCSTIILSVPILSAQLRPGSKTRLFPGISQCRFNPLQKSTCRRIFLQCSAAWCYQVFADALWHLDLQTLPLYRHLFPVPHPITKLQANFLWHLIASLDCLCWHIAAVCCLLVSSLKFFDSVLDLSTSNVTLYLVYRMGLYRRLWSFLMV